MRTHTASLQEDVRVCFVPFLETTAARARYHHNVGQVYNMVIRDLREWVSVCVKREGGKKERPTAKHSFSQNAVTAPSHLIPTSVCVRLSVWTRSASSVHVAPRNSQSHACSRGDLSPHVAGRAASAAAGLVRDEPAGERSLDTESIDWRTRPSNTDDPRLIFSYLFLHAVRTALPS